MPRRLHFPYSRTYSVLYLFSSLVLLISILCFTTMAEASTPQPGDSSADKAAVHIVYTERPKDNEESEAFHIRTLASVLGSEDAAKEALLYSYKDAASGFSAKLTPEQVEQMSRQPGVVQVVPNRIYKLHSGPTKLQ